MFRQVSSTSGDTDTVKSQTWRASSARRNVLSPEAHWPVLAPWRALCSLASRWL